MLILRELGVWDLFLLINWDRGVVNWQDSGVSRDKLTADMMT